MCKEEDCYRNRVESFLALCLKYGVQLNLVKTTVPTLNELFFCFITLSDLPDSRDKVLEEIQVFVFHRLHSNDL